MLDGNRYDLSRGSGTSKNSLSNPELAEEGNSDHRRLLRIPISKINENPWQARSTMEVEKFEKLKASIDEEGMHHPIVVLEERGVLGVKYIVKAGHRRLRAHKELGLELIDAKVYTSAFFADLAAVSTNELSSDIHPIDKGVEILSLEEVTRREGSEISIKLLEKKFGVKKTTIYEWKHFAKISKHVRAKVIEANLNKKTLKSIADFCIKIEADESLTEKKQKKKIESYVEELVAEKLEKRKISPDLLVEKSSKGPTLSNFFAFNRLKNEFDLKEKVILKVASLSEDHRKRMLELAKRLVEILEK